MSTTVPLSPTWQRDLGIGLGVGLTLVVVFFVVRVSVIVKGGEGAGAAKGTDVAWRGARPRASMWLQS